MRNSIVFETWPEAVRNTALVHNKYKKLLTNMLVFDIKSILDDADGRL